MPQFEYQVKDHEGKSITGTQEAPDVNVLVSTLREKGFFIVRVNEVKKKQGPFAVGKAAQGITGRRGKVKLDDLVVFSRQLATMVEAGVPLIQALSILSEQTENLTLKKMIIDIHDLVEGGKSLSESLEKHKKTFSSLFVNMVKAGEQSGSLDEILDRLATYIEKSSALQKKVQAAMVYPAVVSAMAFVITTGMLVFVIPKFAGIFESLNAPLPLPTLVLIATSDFLRGNFIFLSIGVGCFIALFNVMINTPKGRLWFDSRKLSIPVFGPLMLKVAVSKFSRTLSTLIRSGVPILTSLEIVSKTAGNKMIELVVNDVKNSIREGESIAGPLAKKKVFPPMVVRMVGVGEETGELEKMLAKVADFYDTQVDAAIQGLTSLIEPFVIAFLATVIGGIVIAMFLPILTLTSLIK